jgi:glyoxylase-like metal-dependent hydrolase (beta-lactamase superfamily II)
MHADDVDMAEHGDMFWNRKKGNRLYRSLVPRLFRFVAADRFQPDVIVGDGADLTEYGFDAKVISIPGHSKGSISILTSAGDLFCGDLLENTKQPAASSIVDDIPTAQASIEKLESQDVKIVYPGHGKPFPMKLFLKKR